MFYEKGRLKDIFFFFIHLFLSILLVFIFAQFALFFYTKYEADEYSKTLLKRAEEITFNINGALNDINKNMTGNCLNDLDLYKKVSYQYRFVEDAGEIRGNLIKCSAMMDHTNDSYIIGAESAYGYDGKIIRENVIGYVSTALNVRIISDESAFVVISPNAFHAYKKDENDNIGGEVYSLKTKAVYEKLGWKENRGLFTITARHCSTKYSVCTKANGYFNLFALLNNKIIILIILCGFFLGILEYYIFQQIFKNRKSLRYRLKHAVKQRAIFVVYQPIVWAETGEIRGFEVLARWHDRYLKMVPPDVFIKEAEHIGLLEQVTKMIVDKAIDEMKHILAENPALYISLNLNAKEVILFGVIDYILENLEKNNIRKNQIAIEILEDSTANLKEIEAAVMRVKAEGLNIFIDDFGSGYSSLAYLSMLKVDKIKIDRSFTNALGTASPALFILTKVCEIADEIGAAIIFEGIETNEQRESLIQLNPHALAQGWLYSRAVPLSEVSALLARKYLV